jgi:hypothetical protein
MNKLPENNEPLHRRQLLGLALSSAAALGLAACGGGGGGDAGAGIGGAAGGAGGAGPGSGASGGAGGLPSGGAGSGSGGVSKSVKRGIAYDLASGDDLAALAPGVSWWYDWGLRPSGSMPADYRARYGMDFIPMLWNGSFDASEVEAFLAANPSIEHLLLLNEPNLTDQANLTPSLAALLWPRYEAVAAHTGVKLVGPTVTWGTMPGFGDPIVWLDAFYAAYRANNGNRDPRIDYLAFHWYDYGLAGQLDRLLKYGKSFWVTEFANWNSQVDTVAEQKAQMTDMVKTCEDRADVFRYAWFTGRWGSDLHHTSLLGANGQLTELGQLYISLPFK